MIYLYNADPTKNDTDGIKVTEEGSMKNPIKSGVLNATTGEEGDPIKLALRCDEGFETTGEVVLKLTGGNEKAGNIPSNWCLAPDNSGLPGEWNPWGQELRIAEAIGDRNHIFWLKARVEKSGVPVNDKSLVLNVKAEVTAKEDNADGD